MPLVLVACGSSGGSKQLTEDDYLSELNDICAYVDRAIGRLEEPADFAAAATYAEDFQKIVSDGISDLSKLTPPESLRRDHEDLLAATRDSLRAGKDLQTASEKQDAAALTTAGEDALKASQDRSAIAAAIGATECVSDDYTGPVNTDPPGSTPDSGPPDSGGGNVPPPLTAPDVEIPVETQPPVTLDNGRSISVLDMSTVASPPGYSIESFDDATVESLIADFESDPVVASKLESVGAAQVLDGGIVTAVVLVFVWRSELSAADQSDFTTGFTESGVSSPYVTPQLGLDATAVMNDDGTTGLVVHLSGLTVALVGDGSVDALGTILDGFLAANAS